MTLRLKGAQECPACLRNWRHSKSCPHYDPAVDGRPLTDEFGRPGDRADFPRSVDPKKLPMWVGPPKAPCPHCAQIVALILAVENRCMAADGPVTPTSDEITEADLIAIYREAKKGAKHA